MTHRTPQRKKRLSLERDHRAVFGRDPASRKALPSRRSQTHRANRQRADRELRGVLGPVDEVRADRAEERLRGTRPVVFRKFAGVPLGEFVRGKIDERAGGDRMRWTAPR
ncbi:hypothetical protein ABIA39_000453 [Nocardia sp. GAS34]|uniref:hypothetical protein n=1 Tax=unclassified Nocardia TaxID=2637762 RepID=UPI003D203E95